MVLALSEGQTHEMKLAYTLLADVADAYVVGDSAYDAKPLADELEQRGCIVVIVFFVFCFLFFVFCSQPIPHARPDAGSIDTCIESAHWWRTFSSASSVFAASPRATTSSR